MRTYAAIFFTVFLAELGDKTQLATVLFATDRAVSSLGVFVAAAAALAFSTALAVLVGSRIGAWIPPRHLQVIAGVGFIAIGVWMLWRRG